MAVELNAIVSQRIEVAPGLIILRIVPDGWELAEFEPGQFTVLGLPDTATRIDLADPDDTPSTGKMIRRAYSIASSSKSKEYIEFFISLVRSGRLTPRLFALTIGDRVLLGKRNTGMFTLKDLPEEVNIVFVATGTGLAPYMSMIRTYLGEHPNRKIALLLGAWHSWDLGYRSELHSLNSLFEHFHFFPVISKPDDEYIPWGGHVGFVQDVWEVGGIEKAWGGTKPDPAHTHIFLCGSPAMIIPMREKMLELGFTLHEKHNPGTIHIEEF